MRDIVKWFRLSVFDEMSWLVYQFQTVYVTPHFINDKDRGKKQVKEWEEVFRWVLFYREIDWSINKVK